MKSNNINVDTSWLISVIIPVYNKEKHIKKCIDSVLNQSYQNFEIILVDDGSFDNSGKILDDYLKKDERIKVFHIENGGVLAARNFGVKKSNGEFISFIDADDTVEPEYLEKLLDILLVNKCDISQCNYSNVLEDIKTPVSNSGEILIQNSDEAIEYLLLGKKYVVGLWPKLYKRELFYNISEYRDIKVHEDYIVNFSAFQNAKKTAFIDLPLYNYYNNEDSVTHLINRVKFCQDVKFVSKLVLEKSKNKPYEKLALARYQKSYLSLYNSMLSDNKVGKEEKQKCLNELKSIYKGDNLYNSKEKFKAMIFIYTPFIYKIGFRFYDKIRKKKLDPEQ